MPAETLDSLDPRALGARLREARNAGGWTQEQAAEAIDASRTTMTAIEKGERTIRPDELVQLAKLYGRKVSSLLRPGEPVEDFSVQLRAALPPERRRHSMAHEYGHFVTDRYRSEITILNRYERRPAGERFAEAFGRALLMPASSLRRRFHEAVRQRRKDGTGGPTAGDLCQLAHYFFVSFEAMTRRLEELALVRSGT